jgi:branched-chain amino acid transport system substrate-binding protein
VPKEIGGVPIKVIVLDDGGDPTRRDHQHAALRHRIQGRHHHGLVDDAADGRVSTVANEAGIPHIGLAPFPINEARMKWSVAMPQPIPIMGKVLYEHMKAHGIKSVGYIGYSIPTAISGSTTSRPRPFRWE